MFHDFIRRTRESRVRYCDRRIPQLTEAIDGTDAEMWPEVVAEHEIERQRLALRRADLRAKLDKE